MRCNVLLYTTRATWHGTVLLSGFTNSPFFSLHRTPMADRSYQMRQTEQSWSTAPQQVRHDYGERYFAKFMSTLRIHLSLSSKKTHEVIDCLEHATLARFPKSRYVPGQAMCILSNGFGALPNFLQDMVVIAAMKANVRPHSMEHIT